MNITEFCKNKLVDFILRGQSFTPPATFYYALTVTTPTDAVAGQEVVGGSYSRVAYTNSLANWAGTQGAGTTTASTGVGGSTSNNASITFPAPTPPTDWGQVVAWEAWDSLIGGNRWMWGVLDNPKSVSAGDQAPEITPGKIVHTFGG